MDNREVERMLMDHGQRIADLEGPNQEHERVPTDSEIALVSDWCGCGIRDLFALNAGRASVVHKS